ncbi:MAG: dihydropteroate synthase [Gammaproteobacteria bacterium]
MGVLNVTPDSFSDGGRHEDPGLAIQQCLRMAGAGADIIDIGGESTRPGAVAPGAAAELARVIPVIRGLRAASGILISVDTSEPEVMRAAVAAGADVLNDVRALRQPGALEAAAACGVPVCLMHMQGTPATMQREPRYEDVAAEVLAFLMERVAECVAAGLGRESLIIDPGFGFGKTLEHNVTLLRRLDVFVATGLPVLAGLSRKSLIGQLAGEPQGAAAERLGGSVALALAARARGARIVRVHDVGPTVQAFRVMDGLESRA